MMALASSPASPIPGIFLCLSINLTTPLYEQVSSLAQSHANGIKSINIID